MVISIYDVESYLRKQLSDYADKVAEVMKEEVPVRSGALRKSIRKEPDGAWAYFVGSTLDQAYYTEHGRGEVRPKRAKFLHYYLKDGTEIFSKYSRPAPAQHWVEATANRFK